MRDQDCEVHEHLMGDGRCTCTKEETQEKPFEALNALRDLYHNNSLEAGWWDQLSEVKIALMNSDVSDPEGLCKTVEKWFLATKIALIHSEVSEMMEGLRKGLTDDHLPHRSMEEVEGSDILIRLFDYAGFQDLDLSGATEEKGNYNMVRPDHKIAEREDEEGKKF